MKTQAESINTVKRAAEPNNLNISIHTTVTVQLDLVWVTFPDLSSVSCRI